MGLVKYALKLRVSFYVLSVLILFLGISAIVTVPSTVTTSAPTPVARNPATAACLILAFWTCSGLLGPR